MCTEKATCHYQIKFISDDFVQMYKTLQLFTSLIRLSTKIFTSIEKIKTHVHILTQTQKLLKLPKSLKLGFN